jgi:hypothetical protein
MTTSERGLPPGRLASFEDGEEMPTDLAAILGARPPRRSTSTPSPTEPELQSASASRLLTEPSAAPENGKQTEAGTSPGHDGPAPATAPQAEEPNPRPAPARREPSQRRRAKSTPEKAGREDGRPRPEGTADYHDRANQRKTSVFHLPTPLQQQVIQHRADSGLSNGQIVIAAIEQAHPRLGELIGTSTVGGGGLFIARAAAPQDEGPVSPLNVSMFAADFDVIDDLVSTFKASSRTQLVRVSLEAYFAAASG